MIFGFPALDLFRLTMDNLHRWIRFGAKVWCRVVVEASNTKVVRTGTIAVEGFVSSLTCLSSCVFFQEPQLVRGMDSSPRVTRVRISVMLLLSTERSLLLVTMVGVRVP